MIQQGRRSKIPRTVKPANPPQVAWSYRSLNHSNTLFSSSLSLDLFLFLFLRSKPPPQASETQDTSSHAYHALLPSSSLPSVHDHPSVTISFLQLSSALHSSVLGSKAPFYSIQFRLLLRSVATTQPHEVFAASLDPPLPRSRLPLHLPDIRSPL